MKRVHWGASTIALALCAGTTASAQRPVVRDDGQVCVSEPRGAGTSALALAAGLDPVIAPRGVGSLTVVVHVPATNPAFVSISTTSLGAEVTDSTPRRWDSLPTAQYTIDVRGCGFGYQRLTAAVAVRAGGDDTLTVRLRERAGCYWVDTVRPRPRRPPGALALRAVLKDAAGFVAGTGMSE